MITLHRFRFSKTLEQMHAKELMYFMKYMNLDYSSIIVLNKINVIEFIRSQIKEKDINKKLRQISFFIQNRFYYIETTLDYTSIRESNFNSKHEFYHAVTTRDTFEYIDYSRTDKKFYIYERAVSNDRSRELHKHRKIIIFLKIYRCTSIYFEISFTNEIFKTLSKYIILKHIDEFCDDIIKYIFHLYCYRTGIEYFTNIKILDQCTSI